MDSESAKTSPPVKDSNLQSTAAVDTGHDSTQGSPSKLSASGIATWAKSLKLPQPMGGSQDESASENGARSPFARLTSGLGLRLSPKTPKQDDSPEGTPMAPQTGIIGTLTKGFVDTSKNAVKAVQVKARHVVSQNKRRYQDGGFDLDMTYITENIIAMGFPAGDMSSGFFGYVEGFYRNHMEEVIRFFETYHKDKYKVYNLCSERLYDASLFEGKVASFPFDDHNCPPIQLIISFCQSAYSWLKEDIENVVVVHCKAGMARTGLMISSLLLYLKFFPTAEESISYYNQKRCVDAKGLVLPSQIRYVKYFERVLTYFNGEDQPGRRCMLRGIRLHRCPHWIRPSITVSDHNGVLFSTKKHPRTKDLSPEDFWFSTPRKGVMVFALPGEPGLTELSGDFKILFHYRQGDFYCWLNTTMIENRKILTTNDLDGFDKRKLLSPGFQVEVVVVDYDSVVQPKPQPENTIKPAEGTSDNAPVPISSEATTTTLPKDSKSSDKDDEVFSDTESEAKTETASETNSTSGKIASITNDTKNLSLGNLGSTQINPNRGSQNDSAVPGNPIGEVSDFKAMAADTSVFTFGDDEDYESD
uniref:phosphatidylinositol 3,4,5-trisphosphate 3-phosphatase and protein-tyrosine-phosphatase PTEN2A-like n=1 Tax=Erigeron canadensis TaxID=72917 RepID=UPI001CB971B3|nr:phosphatidylinositol 3,4,5-trisphosphate 3-phosphatase and protein-tyrosine-phosphatase PTEN2A-like [Erigeron canadensis]XP_043627725.1 phosphatidylinositol 3,4,5-trisphosphate 3-phosphatase and protein-tyrosine-phosphatase PTEN2A-like [Erigeron canadensis]